VSRGSQRLRRGPSTEDDVIDRHAVVGGAGHGQREALLPDEAADRLWKETRRLEKAVSRRRERLTFSPPDQRLLTDSPVVAQVVLGDAVLSRGDTAQV